MNKIFTLFAALFVSSVAFAQLNGDGFYRVQNVKTERYIRVIDDYGKVNVTSTTADMGALKTLKGFDNISYDPAAVIYFKKESEGYNLKAQGTSLYEIISYFVKIWDNGDGTYRAYATQAGVSIYLNDEVSRRAEGVLGSNDATSRDWYIKPVTQEDGAFFGIKPDITVGNKYYKSFFASFPFSCASTGMNVYYVCKVDKAKGVAVYKEISGNVPEKTPVFFKCSNAEPVNNKLYLKNWTVESLTDNKLTGVYFCNPNAGPVHTNVVDYDAATMRVLGTTADGSLGYVTAQNLQYIPANTAYLKVEAGTPAELKLVTEEEYATMKTVTVTAKSYTRQYGDENPVFEYTSNDTFEGTPVLTCEATATSPVGTYEIKVAQGSVTGANVIGVAGVLTIEKATLTVTAANAERAEGEENPEFLLGYEGFKNGEDVTVLTQVPTATTTATKDSPAGEYAIEVSGGEAQNYSFAYVNGVLTVKPSTKFDSETENGVNSTYEIQEDNTVTYVTVNESEEPVDKVEIPATVTNGDTEYPVTAIGEEAFEGMTSLETVIIPESIEEIGKDAFAGCTGLMEIYIYRDEPIDLTKVAAARPLSATTDEQATVDPVFSGVNKDECRLYVPQGSKEKYQAAFIWGDFKNIIEMEGQGIVTLTTTLNGGTEVYNLNGQKVSTLKKGVYVVNGQKVLVK